MCVIHHNTLYDLPYASPNLFTIPHQPAQKESLDYATEFNKWEDYLKSFDLTKTTPKLPEFLSDKEKYFIR